MEKFAQAAEFVAGLNEKFAGKYEFALKKGRKYAKVVQRPVNSPSEHAHAFVDAEGHVYKAAGYATPAAGIRYVSVRDALEAADPYGSYLYAR